MGNVKKILNYSFTISILETAVPLTALNVCLWPIVDVETSTCCQIK